MTLSFKGANSTFSCFLDLSNSSFKSVRGKIKYLLSFYTIKYSIWKGGTKCISYKWTEWWDVKFQYASPALFNLTQSWAPGSGSNISHGLSASIRMNKGEALTHEIYSSFLVFYVLKGSFFVLSFARKWASLLSSTCLEAKPPENVI